MVLWLKRLVLFIANPRLLVCFIIAWIITNGWAYIAFTLGGYFDISWLTAVGGTYLAFLWLPISQEKIITFGIAILLLKKIFPNDTKTLAVLNETRQKIIDAIKLKKTSK